MEVIAPNSVIGWADYLTAGKRYDAYDICKYGFVIKDDEREEIHCLWEQCPHAHGDWIKVEDEGND